MFVVHSHQDNNQHIAGVILDVHLVSCRTTPSYVAFTDTERLIGDAAKNQVAMNPRNTVFDAKRLIGRHFSEPLVQEDMRHWSFTVKAGPGDKPIIEGEVRPQTSIAL